MNVDQHVITGQPLSHCISAYHNSKEKYLFTKPSYNQETLYQKGIEKKNKGSVCSFHLTK